MSTAFQHVGIVAIGRNEGERLKVCLRSLIKQSQFVVYVDSGSTDGSVAFAQSIGVEVVNLDTSIPFTAARARNEGVAALKERWAGIEYVQVVDGDCELQEKWVNVAHEFLESNPDAAIACGRTRERYPEKSVYNQLCDLEWDTPIGIAKSCGGIALIRLSAFNEVDGYNPILIAGEEPELCVRLQANGYLIHRLDHEMALHDAAITKFGQYWKRAKRTGHAYAQVSDMHGRPPVCRWVKEARSAVIWGLGFPILAIVAAWWTFGISIVLYCMLLCVQYWRMRAYETQQGRSKHHAHLLALYTLLAKYPQASGVLLYRFRKLTNKQATLIEYKSQEGTENG